MSGPGKTPRTVVTFNGAEVEYLLRTIRQRLAEPALPFNVECHLKELEKRFVGAAKRIKEKS